MNFGKPGEGRPVSMKELFYESDPKGSVLINPKQEYQALTVAFDHQQRNNHIFILGKTGEGKSFRANKP